MVQKLWGLMAIQTNEDIIEYLEAIGYDEEHFILYREFPTAFVGVAEQPGGWPVAVYSYWDMVNIMVMEGYDLEEACEFIDTTYEEENHGKKTPIIMEICLNQNTAK
jgi:hypothetical protein